ncbi:sensor histidine kinase [Deinococcus cellulosilyticus]|uniref:histidine kinase n=1 Tax=Deinococcus cellulosilyticus (strain DSM 18568 / NBRC 106333 / KACC 11606 / 5516J-15) TaxID=1223518 RepID=A0A511MW07_DEIC1|nr:HAMP domain-containing sensor histidine kinase [Deinococcus cellulosilyticus]GEM44764.1 two-component sensor histidine kinase [Deinococcus cellulosilyticus NBRC 106333 = KACC 11606]
MLIPKRSLRLQVMLGFALACVAGLLAFGLLVNNLTVRSYQKTVQQNEFNRFVEAALRYHQEVGSWEGLARRPEGPGGPRHPVPPRHIGVVDAEGQVVSNMDEFPLGSTPDVKASSLRKELVVNGQLIGTVFHDSSSDEDSWGKNAEALVATSTRTLIYSGAIGLVLSLLFGAYISGQLIRPLERLTLAAGSLKFGRQQEKVPVTSEDEVGTLTVAFNEMSEQLVKAEQQRRQMIADIAHDLGTPLTVASGYVQSMHQGKLAATRERLDVVYDELLLLQNLVDDLRLLSLADAGMLTLHRDFTPPGALMQTVQKAFAFRAEKQNIRLTLQLDDALPEVNLDVERMRQVLGNLVNNALHYTPEGGEIRLMARKVEGGVMLQVQDTGVGIPAEKLPFIFERFYRVDETRSPENGGGSGLGLAIARSIVELHGGKISAQSVLRQGTTINIEIPDG